MFITQDRAVGGDEGKEYPKGLVKAWVQLLQGHLDQLHQGRYDQYERKGVQVLEPHGDQDEVVQEPGYHGGEEYDEYDRHAHSLGGAELRGYPKEGAAPQELGEYYVVHENGAQEYPYEAHLPSSSVLSMLHT
jgi:hypothetical protein